MPRTVRIPCRSLPSPEHARGLEAYLNTVCDHGLNASTFAARVIVSTGSDLVSAVCGPIGALKVPLHGGRLIRPESRYVGPRGRRYTPLDQR